ncbi:hypothetical protein, variant 1 [Cladophialophora immunda]|uniref:Uncharacterized protein n=2 Tax=Cladophialophora immunda TaxID=569365 RepID=A0A0D2CMT2_9EURO|nr:hypothetical protein, variant 1 [Cladophialophora immunda]KIW31365.1 hypothetical protein, variant 1 [Cladophialophora immunda]
MASLVILKQVDGRFEKTSVNASTFLGTRPQQGVQFVFAKWDLLGKDNHLRDLICSDWAYPPMLWTKTCREANGYAGSARGLDKDQKTLVDTSWFQFLVKQLRAGANTFQQEYVYEWYEMEFFMYVLSSGASVAFCIDTPPAFQNGLLEALNSGRNDPPKDAMAFLQCAVVAEVSRLYDVSVWTLRDKVRELEKIRSAARYLESGLDFPRLHDLARHIIHTCEVLSVAADTVNTLLVDHRSSSGKACECAGASGHSPNPNCPHTEMRFWLGLLQNFGRRAKSLNERLSHEITLGFNLVVQRDTRATMEISSAARSDSASMKTIAVVTLAFLPATFVCTIFSMSFFTLNVDDATGEKHWMMSDRFWIYWVITVPLTVLTLICWWYGQHRGDKQGKAREPSWKSEGP